MTDPVEGTMPLREERDIVLCRQQVRALAQRASLSVVNQTKIITAASELSRNTVKYGGGGEMRWALVSEGVRSGVRLWFEDQGPGIPDLDLALQDGWTSGGGMGLGLSGSKRLSDEFELRSAPGQGTCVTITRWK